MNRRGFLKLLGLVGAVAAVPAIAKVKESKNWYEKTAPQVFPSTGEAKIKGNGPQQNMTATEVREKDYWRHAWDELATDFQPIMTDRQASITMEFEKRFHNMLFQHALKS